jgi:hypothetical protein
MTTRHKPGRGMKRHVAAALKAAQAYQATLDLPIKTQQRFYARLQRAVNRVAETEGMSAADVFEQITKRAHELGPVPIQPGKDY